MKKHSMIPALILALTMAFVFVGCGGSVTTIDASGAGGGGPTGTPEVVFKLSEVLEGIGAQTGIDQDSDIFDDTPLQLAAQSINVDLVSEGGSIVMQITTGKDWGEGLDIIHGDAFQFQAGDKIVVTGKVIDFSSASGAAWATDEIHLKVPSSADNGKLKTTDLDANAPFTFTYTLTSGDVNSIIISDPPGIRVGGRPTGAKFQITEITVTGLPR